MVQASTLIIAAFAVAPILAAPLHRAPEAHTPYHPEHEAAPARVPHFRGQGRGAAAHPRHLAARDVLETEFQELDARDPKFNLGKAFKSIGHVAGKIGGVALKAAPLLIRDLEDDTLDAREPINFKKLVGSVGKVALGTAKLLIRDENGDLVERDVVLDADALSELDARDPINFKKLVSGVGKVAVKLLVRDEDGAELMERDVLIGGAAQIPKRRRRRVGHSEELEARDPSFNLGAAFKKVTGVATKVFKVADQVSSKAHALGLRELDAEEDMMEVRSIDDLD